MDVAIIMEFFFYAIVLIFKICIRTVYYIGVVIRGLQILLLKVGIVFCVVYDVCAVASITSLIMKQRGMENVLTKLFDRMIHGKVAQGTYHLSEKIFSKDFGSGVVVTILSILLAILIIIVGTVVSNVIIWWPCMVASILLQFAIYVVYASRSNTNVYDTVLVTTSNTTEDVDLGSTVDSDDNCY